MEIRTPQDLIETVAEKWFDSFYDYENGCWYDNFGLGERDRRIYQELIALENPTAEAIKAIIGNDSWTQLYCSECMGEGFEYVIVFDAWEDGVESTLCRDCFGKAITLLTEYIQENTEPYPVELGEVTAWTPEQIESVAVTSEPQPPEPPEPCDCGKGAYCPVVQQYNHDFEHYLIEHYNWSVREGLVDRGTLGLD